MNQIKLDCFVNDNTCQLISLDKRLTFNDPLVKEVFLEINNHSFNHCLVKMTAQSLTDNENLETFDLLIIKGEEILFNNNFAQFLKTEIDLGAISVNSSVSYAFQMDLLDSILAQNKLLLNFSLIFNFTCDNFTSQLKQKEEGSDSASKKHSVLSATSNPASIGLSQESSPLPVYLFFLLSILFVIIFFVIIKLIHEYKKKKQRKV